MSDRAIVRVLIIKRDKLGDLLLTRPVLARLAAGLPAAEIHLLANDYNAWVARDHPALAHTWVYPRARSEGRLHVAAALRQVPLGWRLRHQRFDWALVMGGDESHRAIRRALATRASRVVAYAREPARYGPGLTDPLPPPTFGHETARMLALLAPLGMQRVADGMTTPDGKPHAASDAPTFAISPRRDRVRAAVAPRAPPRAAVLCGDRIGCAARKNSRLPTRCSAGRRAC